MEHFSLVGASSAILVGSCSGGTAADVSLIDAGGVSEQSNNLCCCCCSGTLSLRCGPSRGSTFVPLQRRLGLWALGRSIAATVAADSVEPDCAALIVDEQLVPR